MTNFGAEIQLAADEIKANGLDVTVRREAEASSADYTESDFGTATFNGSVTFDQDVSGSISDGDRIEFAQIDSFANRAERTVDSVSTDTVTVGDDYASATESSYVLTVTKDNSQKTTTQAVADQGGGRFESQFRDGTLLRSEAKVLFIAAKGLPFRIRPGDYVDMPERSWLVHDVNTIEPDSEPILFEILAKRG